MSSVEDCVANAAACALLWYGNNVFKNQNKPNKDIQGRFEDLSSVADCVANAAG